MIDADFLSHCRLLFIDYFNTWPIWGRRSTYNTNGSHCRTCWRSSLLRYQFLLALDQPCKILAIVMDRTQCRIYYGGPRSSAETRDVYSGHAPACTVSTVVADLLVRGSAQPHRRRGQDGFAVPGSRYGAAHVYHILRSDRCALPRVGFTLSVQRTKACPRTTGAGYGATIGWGPTAQSQQPHKRCRLSTPCRFLIIHWEFPDIHSRTLIIWHPGSRTSDGWRYYKL